MAIYGYIENGILHTKKIEGVMIPSGYKPVEDFDFSKTQTEDGYIIEVVPCDVGDKIVYNYEKRFDRKKVKSEIETLKEKLSDGDYRVIKCYEATLAKIKMPYDIEAIHKERQAIRDKINELELKLSANA